MTSYEAKKKIDVCEQKIVSAHSGLKDRAQAVGTDAVSAAASKTTTSTLLSLIICVIGLFFLGGSTFLGILLIGGGIFVAFKVHESAQSTQRSIENGQRNLDTTINNNSKI